MHFFHIKPNDPKTILIALVLIGTLIFALQIPKSTPTPNSSSETIPIIKMPLSEKKEKYAIAPELAGIAGYINTNEGFKLADVQGKVILVDFWTFSCINCIRTQPYLNAWQEKYADKGLVIVGVHTPEFDFEKEIENVQKAVEKEKIKYPVVLDNDFSTWRVYKNRYWPRKYLIDSDGFIRYDHIGEGAYEETEEMIKQLLKERDEKIKLEKETAAESIAAQNFWQDFSQIGTPELYLGYEFSRAPLGNAEGFQPNQIVSYVLPQNGEMEPNLVYLEGEWKNNADHVELVSETGKVKLVYKAKALNMVAGNAGELQTNLDGIPLQEIEKGEDVQFQNGVGVTSIADKKLYNLVNANDYSPRLIEINVTGKGFQLYTFTFG